MQTCLMEVNSISYSTLLHVLSHQSGIYDKGDHIVIQTPENPGHCWGNFLLFQNAPEEGSLSRWQKLFKKEFKNIPGIRHIAFAWDSTQGESGAIAPFTKSGYHFEKDDILVAGAVHIPEKFNYIITARPLLSEEDWMQAVELNITCAGNQSELYRNYIMKRTDAYRKMGKNGYGVWMGAFLKNKLVGDMALFEGGTHTGLFEMVKTHPAYRRRGVCRTLLYHASVFGKEKLNFEKLVLVSDQTSNATGIYKAVGYEIMEYGASLIIKI